MQWIVWLALFCRFWSIHVDALERCLDRMDPPQGKKEKEGAER